MDDAQTEGVDDDITDDVPEYVPEDFPEHAMDENQDNVAFCRFLTPRATTRLMKSWQSTRLNLPLAEPMADRIAYPNIAPGITRIDGVLASNVNNWVSLVV